jgi:hypothetical protein
VPFVDPSKTCRRQIANQQFPLAVFVNQQSAIDNQQFPLAVFRQSAFSIQHSAIASLASAYASDSRRSPGPRRGGGQPCTYRKSSSRTLGLSWTEIPNP